MRHRRPPINGNRVSGVTGITRHILALDYGSDGAEFRRWWTGGARRVHLVGKGVLRFHAVYWLTMLLSAGLPVPDEVLVHGYLAVYGRKISKSGDVTVEDGGRYFTEARIVALRRRAIHGWTPSSLGWWRRAGWSVSCWDRSCRMWRAAFGGSAAGSGFRRPTRCSGGSGAPGRRQAFTCFGPFTCSFRVGPHPEAVERSRRRDGRCEQGTGAGDDRPVLTNRQGHPVYDNQNQRTIGARGPATLENYQFLEKISHFDRERIPERVVHARGTTLVRVLRVVREMGRRAHRELQPGQAVPG